MSYKSQTTIFTPKEDLNEMFCGKYDEDHLRQGLGCERWTLDSDPDYFQRYTGSFLNNTIHGYGQFLIQRNSKFFYYNGNFYNNKIEGYSQVIYDNGTNFEGLFKNHMRFGPGIVTNQDLSQDVGLWVNNTLIRLCCVISPDWIPKIAKTAKGKIKLLKFKDLVEVCIKKRNLAKEILRELRVSEEVMERVYELYNSQVRHGRSLFFNNESYDNEFYGEEDCVINVEVEEPEINQIQDSVSKASRKTNSSQKISSSDEDGKLSSKMSSSMRNISKSPRSSKMSMGASSKSSKVSSKSIKISEDTKRSDVASSKSSKLSSAMSKPSKYTDTESTSKTLDDVETITEEVASPPPVVCTCATGNKLTQLEYRIQELEIQIKSTEIKTRSILKQLGVCQRCCKRQGLSWGKSVHEDEKEYYLDVYREKKSLSKLSTLTDNLSGLLVHARKSADFYQSAMSFYQTLDITDSKEIYEEIIKSYIALALLAEADEIEDATSQHTMLYSEHDSKENITNEEEERSYQGSMKEIMDYLKLQEPPLEEHVQFVHECECELQQIGNIDEVKTNFKNCKTEYHFLVDARRVLMDKLRIDKERDQEKQKKNILGNTKQVRITHLLAWNNEQINKEILKHTFLNRKSEENVRFNVRHLMEARRDEFAPPGLYEKQCMNFLFFCQKGLEKEVSFLARKYNINPDVCDCNGNTGIFFASAKDRITVIPTLLYLGANIDIFNDEGLTPLTLSFLRVLALKNDVIDWEIAFLPDPIIRDEEKFQMQEILPSFTATTLANFRKFGHSSLSLNLQMSKEWFKPLVATNSPNEQKQADAYVFDTKYPKYSKPSEVTKAPQIEPKTTDSRLTFELHNQASTENNAKEQTKILLTITTLLGNGANPNNGEVPFKVIFLSLFTDDSRFLSALLTHNVDIEVIMTEDNLTPLHVLASISASKENYLMLEMLVLAKADPNAKTHINHWREQKKELVGKIDKGSIEKTKKDTSKKISGSIKTKSSSTTKSLTYKSRTSSVSTDLCFTDNGKTPLQILCLREDYGNDPNNYLGKMALVLINAGADYKEFYMGHTPLSLAVFKGNTHMITSLLSYKYLDPYQELEYNMGNVLTIYCLKKYCDFFNLETCVEVLNVLVSIGVNPLHRVYDCENAVVFLENEHQILPPPEDTPKSGKKTPRPPPPIKQTMQTRLVGYIKELARNNLMKYTHGKMVELMYEFFFVGLKDDELIDVWANFVTKNDAIKIVLMLFQAGVLDFSTEFDANACVVLLEHVEKFQDKIKKTPKKKTPEKKTTPPTPKVGAKNSPVKKGSPDSKTAKRNSVDVKKSASITSSDDLLPATMTIIDAIRALNFRKIYNPDANIYLVQPEVDREEEKYKVCYQCLRGENRTLFPCPKCYMIFFCSQNCNKENLLLKPPLNKHKCKLLFYSKQKSDFLAIITARNTRAERAARSASSAGDLTETASITSSILLRREAEFNKYEILIEKIYGRKYNTSYKDVTDHLKKELELSQRSKNGVRFSLLKGLVTDFRKKRGPNFEKFKLAVGKDMKSDSKKIDKIREFMKNKHDFLNDILGKKRQKTVEEFQHGKVKKRVITISPPRTGTGSSGSRTDSHGTRKSGWKRPKKFRLKSLRSRKSDRSRRRRGSRRSRSTSKKYGPHGRYGHGRGRGRHSKGTRFKSGSRSRKGAAGAGKMSKKKKTRSTSRVSICTDKMRWIDPNDPFLRDRPKSGMRKTDKLTDEDDKYKQLMKLIEAGKIDKLIGGRCMCRKLPRYCYLIMELITEYFPDLDFSKLCLPYACYENGQIYYRFIDSNVFCKNFSHM